MKIGVLLRIDSRESPRATPSHLSPKALSSKPKGMWRDLRQKSGAPKTQIQPRRIDPTSHSRPCEKFIRSCQRSGEGVVRGNGRPKGRFWRVRFFSAPVRLALKTPENLEWEEKRRTLQNTLLDDRFSEGSIQLPISSTPRWLWPQVLLAGPPLPPPPRPWTPAPAPAWAAPSRSIAKSGTS